MAIAGVYSFGSSVKRGTSWTGSTDLERGYYVINCPMCHTRGALPYPARARYTVALKITKPGTVDDILWVGSNNSVMSSRARGVVRTCRLSGIRFVQPTLIECEGRGAAWNATARILKAGDYRIANVTGWGGSVSRLNNVRVTEQCNYCGWMWWSRCPSHLFIDLRQWDGSDFFAIEEYRFRFMTQRAADALAAEGLTNCTPELEGSIIDPRKPVRAPTRKQRYDTNNMYVLTAIYGDPAERAAGVYKPFWTDFLAGKLGERTLSNALRKVKKFRPSGKRWISDWKPLRP